MATYDVSGSALTRLYNKNGTPISRAYDVNGAEVFYTLVPQLSLLHSEEMANLSASTITPQGLAAYGDYFFQFFTGDNKMRVFNRSTFELVGAYSATDILHANTMCFGDTVQETGFPLLYVSTWGGSATSSSRRIDVLKVSTSGYTKETSFSLPASVGNFPSFVADWNAGKAYVIGYSAGTRDSETMIVSYFDLSDLSTPVEQYTVPYMGVLNAWDMYDGKLIFYGNSWDSLTLVVSFIDIETHEVEQYTFEKITNEEYEGAAVIGDTLILSNWIDEGGRLYRFYAMNLI